jgi:hypothetical protein
LPESIPPGWDLDEALATCQEIQWAGLARRAHNARYPADSPGSSTGRYNRGRNKFPDPGIVTWSALYLGLSKDVCLGEALRYLPTSRQLSVDEVHERLRRIATRRLTRLRVELVAVLDLRDPVVLGLTREHLCRDEREGGYVLTHRIAQAALVRQVEGLLVPSATRLGDSLVVFPSQLRPDSSIEIVDFVDPTLYVERDE